MICKIHVHYFLKQFLLISVNSFPETLRMYGSGQILIRTCTKSYRIPESKVVLDPGTRVVIPTYSFHHDPKYFPEPHIFNPDRFSVQNTKNTRPFVFLPFGEGPRNCIGKFIVSVQSVISYFYHTWC